MSDVARILQSIEDGDPHAAEDLLPLVYDELRKLAAAKIAQDAPGQTLDATGLVHEAYLRLASGSNGKPWNGRGHFFAAAAEAMRRILVENARRKNRLKHGGAYQKVDVDPDLLPIAMPDEEVLAVSEALESLAEHDTQAADLVRLHYFAGLTIEESAVAVEISSRTAFRVWSYARAWLFRELRKAEPS